MSDTFFTSSPHWAWMITLYFFVGGVAGGSFFIAALLRLFGRPEDRTLVRYGYTVACAGAIVSGLLLTVDLTRPERFWFMLFQVHSRSPMLKAWSPMSVGAWGLLLFGLVATLAALGAQAEEGRLRRQPLRFLDEGVPSLVIGVVGSLLGLFLAGYTGVLLTVTNRPIWADTSLLGALFLVSGVSTGAACLILISRWRGSADPSSLAWLARFDRGLLGLELLVIVAFLLSLGSVARVFVGVWGVVLLVGVLGAGIVAPLLLEAGKMVAPGRRLALAAALVLLGGLLLRFVVIFSSEQIGVLGAGVVG